MRIITDTCDRCGKEYKFTKALAEGEKPRSYDGFQFFKKNRFINDKKFEYSQKMYLCPECQEELEAWAYDEPDDGTDEEPESLD